MSSTFETVLTPGSCPHCSGGSVQVFHNGPCPRVKKIEYWADGTIKSIEYNYSPKEQLNESHT